MASKPRKKGSRWEVVIKRAGLLEKPLYLFYGSEEAALEGAANIERLLDRGIVPGVLQVEGTSLATVGEVIQRYIQDVTIKRSTREQLEALASQWGSVKILQVNVHWADEWISQMKREHTFAPSTIRTKVSTLAQAIDWARRKELIQLNENPLRNLPNRYADYTETDVTFAGVERKDIERDRRLEEGEEEAIRKVIRKGSLKRKLTPLVFDAEAVMNDFDLALETAMRMRERYTLQVNQVNFRKRTIFLTQTKNGDSREIPLSSVAMEVLKRQIGERKGEEQVFPFWNGDNSIKCLKETTSRLTKFWGSLFAEAGCQDLKQHDLRHEATSRLVERTNLSGETLMKITGHKVHKTFMRYLKLRGSNLASMLW